MASLSLDGTSVRDWVNTHSDPDAKDEKPTVVHIVQPPGGQVREQSGERWRADLER